MGYDKMNKMTKVVSLSSPPMPKDQLNRLIEAVYPEVGDAKGLEFSFNEKDGSLNLYIDGE